MPQHIWVTSSASFRHCDVCGRRQAWHSRTKEWLPKISSICRGDDEDFGPHRKPSLPGSRRPVLDDAG
jgi:hypothetical protein